ncbi:hypothetical protein E1B28_007935 [Marasmius oreades]|uniref:Copper transport protein n=1 Tax=Marasmius oreades TaxID=181124 RepID=A0A9P7UVG6_9AGAR|nr:uncharacterized protein E1B28_007935 [Marasmius oreades]KAG7094336.1 hypothetical protein E1B28_007935 [Marasmius oreades]
MGGFGLAPCSICDYISWSQPQSQSPKSPTPSCKSLHPTTISDHYIRPTMAAAISLLSSLFFARLCLAQDINGMDMTMDMPMDLASGHMLMYFHFTPGDILWFEGWVPQSKGAMVGACIGLFLLALVDRWVAGCRGIMEAHWGKRAQIAYVNKINSDSHINKKVKGTSRSAPSPSVLDLVTMRTIVPFIPAHDIVRGIMQAGQAAIGFALMLAVMTFQVSFLIAIVIGLGVGETLFGRSRIVAHV